MNATGDGLRDVAVVGLGPAGRALASRCAAAGLTVLAVDPAPEQPWRQTLCLWADQVPGWLPRDVVAHTVHGPALYSAGHAQPGRAVLDREYAVLDTDALRDALPLGPRVFVERGSVDHPESLLDRAHRVIDCRGAPRPGVVPMQTAYGIVLDAQDAAPALAGDSAVFMDWRTDYGPSDDTPVPSRGRQGAGRRAAPGYDDDDVVGPTFLYVIPLDRHRILLEETCLAGMPAPEPAVLAGRLRARLLRRGVAAAALDEPLAVEEVRIPLMPPVLAYTDPRVEAFGTAGGHGHAATGYSVAATLGAVPAAVNALATGFPLPTPRTRGTSALNRTGLRALRCADEPTLGQLFGAFGRIDDRRQQWFLDGSGPSYQVAAAMWQMWARMPARGKAGMIAAVAGAPPGRRRAGS